MDIGKIIKGRRKELGLTIKDVGKAVGVAHATVSRWETGNISNMRRDRIYKLAQVLQLNPAEIMGFTEQELRSFEEGDLLAYASTDPEVIEMLELYRKMDRTDRKRVVEFVRALSATS